MKTLLRIATCALVLTFLAGCGLNSPACSDDEVKTLVLQTVRGNYLYRQRYTDQRLEAKVEELADEQFALADISTLQSATSDRPASLCEARVLIEMYDVGRDYERLNASPKPSTSSGMQDRLEAFERDPANLMRLGARRQVEVGVRYSTGQTDDGRTTVRVEAK